MKARHEACALNTSSLGHLGTPVGRPSGVRYPLSDQLFGIMWFRTDKARFQLLQRVAGQKWSDGLKAWALRGAPCYAVAPSPMYSGGSWRTLRCFLDLEVTDSLHVRFLSGSSPSGKRSGGP